MATKVECNTSSPAGRVRFVSRQASLPPLSFFSPRRKAKAWKIPAISEEPPPGRQMASPETSASEGSFSKESRQESRPRLGRRVSRRAPSRTTSRRLKRHSSAKVWHSEPLSPSPSETASPTPSKTSPSRTSPSRSPSRGPARRSLARHVSSANYLDSPRKKFSSLEDAFAEYDKITLDEL